MVGSLLQAQQQSEHPAHLCFYAPAGRGDCELGVGDRLAVSPSLLAVRLSRQVIMSMATVVAKMMMSSCPSATSTP
jgi:hypothetical protein